MNTEQLVEKCKLEIYDCHKQFDIISDQISSITRSLNELGKNSGDSGEISLLTLRYSRLSNDRNIIIGKKCAYESILKDLT